MTIPRLRLPRPMLLLQWHVLREVLVVFLVAFVAVTGLILLAATVVFLRQFPGVELRDVLYVLPLLGAHMSVYTVPLTVLFAVIWTYSRLLQDNEITAMRSCGVHLHTITAPVVLFGLLVTAAMLLMFDQVIPLAHKQKKDLLRRTVVSRINHIRAGESNHLAMGRYEIFVRNISDDGVLEDVIIYQLNSSGDVAPRHRFVVPRARLEYDRVTGVMRLRLMGGHNLTFDSKPPAAGTIERGFERYVFQLPLGRDEIDRARSIENGGGAGLSEVQFEAGSLGFSSAATAAGALADVALSVRPPNSQLECDSLEVEVVLEPTPGLLIRLTDADSARGRTTAEPGAEWAHVFELFQILPLDAAAAGRWKDLLAGRERGEQLEIESSGVAIAGRAELSGEPGRLVLSDATVTITPEPVEIRAETATALVGKSSSGRPVLQLDLRRGRVRGTGSWGASPARLDFTESVDLYLSLDPGSNDGLRLSDMPFAELYKAYLLPLPERAEGERAAARLKDSRLLTEIHYRYSLAFASLFFVLVGAPAAMIVRVSSRMAAFGITLLKVFVLYFPAVVGTKALCASGVLDAHPEWIPVILWSGNALFGLLGGFYFFMLHRR